LGTVDKDFKVKNGLQVVSGGTFGGPVSASTPTLPSHLATKEYVDSMSGGGAGVETGPTPPENPQNGSQWLDTTVEKLKIYLAGEWIILANYTDTLNIVQHTHDTSIGAGGFVDGVFAEAGLAGEMQILFYDGGTPDTISWTNVLDGGTI
jgi:hypothetical protein